MQIFRPFCRVIIESAHKRIRYLLLPWNTGIHPLIHIYVGIVPSAGFNPQGNQDVIQKRSQTGLTEANSGNASKEASNTSEKRIAVIAASCSQGSLRAIRYMVNQEERYKEKGCDHAGMPSLKLNTHQIITMNGSTKLMNEVKTPYVAV